MTGHLAVPALEPDPDVPATMSPKITTDLLRGQMGFDGVVVTDALDMGGVTVRYPPGEVAVRSILAGADVLLVPPVLDAALEAVRDAVASGRIPMSRLDEAVTRVLRAKAKLGLNKSKLVDLNPLAQISTAPNLNARRWTSPIAASRCCATTSTFFRSIRQSRCASCSSRFPATTIPIPPEILKTKFAGASIRSRPCAWTRRFVRAETAKLPSPDTYDVAIAAIFVRVADRKGSVGLPDDEAAVVDRLLAAGKPVIVACFGSPYLVERFPAAKTWIAAFSTVDVAQRAVGRAIFGQVGDWRDACR